MKLRYTVEGTDADSGKFAATGFILGASPMDADSYQAAGAAAFAQLTQGRARFGEPGVTCRGPYKVSKFALEVARD